MRLYGLNYFDLPKWQRDVLQTAMRPVMAQELLDKLLIWPPKIPLQPEFVRTLVFDATGSRKEAAEAYLQQVQQIEALERNRRAKE